MRDVATLPALLLALALGACDKPPPARPIPTPTTAAPGQFGPSGATGVTGGIDVPASASPGAPNDAARPATPAAR